MPSCTLCRVRCFALLPWRIRFLVRRPAYATAFVLAILSAMLCDRMSKRAWIIMVAGACGTIGFISASRSALALRISSSSCAVNFATKTPSIRCESIQAYLKSVTR